MQFFLRLCFPGPTVFPTGVAETSEFPITTGEPVIITGPPVPEPSPVPNLEETTLLAVEAQTEVITVANTPDAPEASHASATEVPDAPTEAPPEEITTLPGETTVYAVEPAGPTQEAPAVETAAPVDPAEPVEGSDASKTEESEDVIVDEPEGEGWKL